jgi:hypothetical protein
MLEGREYSSECEYGVLMVFSICVLEVECWAKVVDWF